MAALFISTGMQLGRVLGVWTPALFSIRPKVPFLPCPLDIKKGAFLRLKRHGTEMFLGASPPAPILPSLP